MLPPRATHPAGLRPSPATCPGPHGARCPYPGQTGERVALLSVDALGQRYDPDRSPRVAEHKGVLDETDDEARLDQRETAAEYKEGQSEP